MTWFRVLVEGGADVPVLREVLTRKFGLREKDDFEIHPHKGRGKLPSNPLAEPERHHQGLLDQLPAKLRSFSGYGDDICVLVVLDVDNTPCTAMLADLTAMLGKLPKRPKRVLFRLAIEETESWLIADEQAVKCAFPRAKTKKLKDIEADAIIGAWEVLADVIGINRKEVTGNDKHHWATMIAPHLDLDAAKSPSLQKLIDGIAREMQNPP
jgi:hypothetical protein